MTEKAAYRFPGFVDDHSSAVTLPEAVFSELVPHLDHPDLLKVVLIALWRLSSARSEGAPWVTDRELQNDPAIVQALAGDQIVGRLATALRAAVACEVLLAAEWRRADGTTETRYFANSPRGRASVSALGRGVSPVRAHVQERPNIFALYEQNIGALTAILAEDLMEAETEFPAVWIEDAFREAVRQNKRSWKYILAILNRWQAEGRDEIPRRTDGRAGPAEPDRDAEARRFVEEAYNRLVRDQTS